MIASQTLLQANLLTQVYHANPTYGREVIVEVFVCNQDSGQWSTMDMALAKDESVVLPEQYIFKGYSLRPNETKRPKVLLREGDTVRVKVTTARVSVVVLAEEIVTPRTIEQLSQRVDNVTEELMRGGLLAEDDVEVG